ncbi:cupredoxin domain-containing protein [Massilia sp. H6]|uniref:cupredoxin domain-containing protein n=1 Tax=Massilia sp. H6 TaxID=2970464 RepID=UPI00216907B1|nr:cupredoxin domain-containing protein [Massilia sp. H6]UVW28053.1 cupredoxin domain-containing protein [Massilia sp. H6]
MKRRIAGVALLVLLAGSMAWAAFAPLQAASRDQLFEIPPGTWERRMKGDTASVLPEQITLTLGVRDVLLLRNSDTVPQMFGPVLIMPGQDFRLPFGQAGEHPFDCTAHASGKMSVLVVDAPAAGLARLRWRLHAILDGAA